MLLSRAVTPLLAVALLAGSPPATARPPRAVVAYRTNGKLIALPVRIGGSRTRWFVLDSGAPHSVVDAAVAKQSRLQVLSTDRGGGAGQGTYALQHLAPVDLAVGTLRLRIAAPVAIDLRHTGVQVPEAGLVGAEVFRRYVVRIDPVARTVAFYDPAGYACPPAAAVIPLSAPANRLYVPMTLTVGSTSIVRRMRVDTGSEDAASDNLVRRSPQRRRSLQGVGLGTPYVDYSGVFDSLRIGPYVIHRAWGASNDRPAVGMEILRRFTSTFDVPGGRLCLEPNAYLTQPVPAPPG